MPKRYMGNTGRSAWVESSPPGRGPAPPRPAEPSARPGLPFLPRFAAELETEDLILLLLCYLLYRESGDSDWLIALGALLLS